VLSRLIWVLLAVTLVSCGDRERVPTNIVVISMDTTRSDHCSVYGYGLDTTPRLKEFFAEGARFNLAYSPTSTTGPNHATLFTSPETGRL
jgi:arylsulfatase A-like enzyme